MKRGREKLRDYESIGAEEVWFISAGALTNPAGNLVGASCQPVANQVANPPQIDNLPHTVDITFRQSG